MVMDRSEDLRDNERIPHPEINEDGRGSNHPGYEIDYCEKCNKPIIHSRMVKVNNCGRKECK